MRFSSLKPHQLTLSHSFENLNGQRTFLDFQSTAKQAMDHFIQLPVSSLLILKTNTTPSYINEIQQYISAKQKTVVKIGFHSRNLFGAYFYLEKENKFIQTESLIQKAENGVLILDIHSLLQDIGQWDKLKKALLFHTFEPVVNKHFSAEIAECSAHFKLILLGSREEIATLAQYDESLYQIGHYAELTSYLRLEDEKALNHWAEYIQTRAKEILHQPFDSSALNQLLQHYVRESESQHLISICPELLNKHLIGLTKIFQNFTASMWVNCYFEQLDKQANLLNQHILQDILNQQVEIETEGEIVGQINGLSVVEFDGVPTAFGEPLRISCNVQYGDGEIIDIERKAELGGNLHSKGVMIAQSCLANLLELPTQLPFSATLAFEQSHSEVDGDSSSLAIWLVLVSSLAKLPLPQAIAVTGAIDQFGNVQSVGGVNQKIEGFFTLCQARGLTSKQGVIIPASCQSHLSLNEAVRQAVAAGQFHIWVVADVFEACELLFERPFFDEEEKSSLAPSLFALIHQHIEQADEEDEASPFWLRWLPFLKR